MPIVALATRPHRDVASARWDRHLCAVAVTGISPVVQSLKHLLRPHCTAMRQPKLALKLLRSREIYAERTMLRTTRIWLMLLCVSASGEGFAVGGEFSLTSADGSSYSLANSRGKVVVLSFGYTFCPDVCPTALGTIGTALNRLTEDEVERIDALFVSLDPDRDTPERLREYTRYFHPRLLGLTGSAEQLRSVADRYRVRYDFVGKGEREHYSMDHGASLYLIDAEGKLFRILPHGLPPQALVDSLRFALNLPDRPDRSSTGRP